MTKKLDNHLSIKRGYLIFIARNEMNMTLEDIGEIFKLTKQAVASILENGKE